MNHECCFVLLDALLPVPPLVFKGCGMMKLNYRFLEQGTISIAKDL